MSDCLFCKIIDKEIPSEAVYEDDNVLGFKDINPSHETHILFVPKNHIDSLLGKLGKDLEFVPELMNAANLYAKEQKLPYHRFVFNNGEPFQEIPHVHLHLLAGKRL